MRPTFLLAAALAFLAGQPAKAEGTRVEAILERLQNANQWRDHVLIAAHRGGWKEGGVIRIAENSVAGVTHSIALGVEIVELDVQASSDGTLVVMHDSWLDRTTTCRGRVVERSVAELKACRLVIEGSGRVTGETVPTLRDMLALTRGRVLVNVDNKIGPDAIPSIVALARAMGMADQVILKENIWSNARLAAIEAVARKAGAGFHFMPIMADDAVEDPRFVERVTRAVSADAVEMVAWRDGRTTMPTDAGPLFGARVKAAAVRGNWHLWVNTYPIVNKPSGFLARGRGDELAVAGSFPEEVYGYWAERGATIIQTDEPKAAIAWLQANGWRVLYSPESVPEATASTASIN